MERKSVPDQFGRLYIDDVQNGCQLGTWVRRAEVDALLDDIDRLRALLDDSREYRKHVQSHCEHDWTETLHGPDTIGEHCHVCGVDRDYDDSDGY